MTEETQQQAEGAAQNDSRSAQQNETPPISSDVGKAKDNKKEKCRPMTKVRLDYNSRDRYRFTVSPVNVLRFR